MKRFLDQCAKPLCRQALGVVGRWLDSAAAVCSFGWQNANVQAAEACEQWHVLRQLSKCQLGQYELLQLERAGS
eukprot:1153051-Pelagomonas_calceolata.AAC.1